MALKIQEKTFLNSFLIFPKKGPDTARTMQSDQGFLREAKQL